MILHIQYAYFNFVFYIFNLERTCLYRRGEGKEGVLVLLGDLDLLHTQGLLR